MSDSDTAKRAAGEAAAALVEEGMVVGLGTGSTAAPFIAALGRRVAAGLRITAVATSVASATQAAGEGIALVDLSAAGVDLAVDGADSVDPGLGLIKGRGGAHVRERIVASAATRFVVIVDDSKVHDRLQGPVPIEIVQFGVERTLAAITEALTVPATLRHDPSGAVCRSDNGNLLGDIDMAVVVDPEGMAAMLDGLAGVVGHGLFLGMADLVIVGSADGGLQLLHPRGD